MIGVNSKMGFNGVVPKSVAKLGVGAGQIGSVLEELSICFFNPGKKDPLLLVSISDTGNATLEEH